MCGIVGAIAERNITPILVEGLKRLEYRGYDSCGVAVHQDGELRRSRSTSRVAELDALVAADGVEGLTGIAHTRWATHGAPAVHNAHPHFSHGPGADAYTARAGRIGLVHNGMRIPGTDGGDVVVLLLSDATRLEIPRSKVEETVASKVSVMPVGVLNELSLAEVADLFAFLETSRFNAVSAP